jgi:hypothetical protein
LVEEEGVATLYTGFRVNLVRVLPACTSTFLIYELLTKHLATLAAKHDDGPQ